MAVEVISMPDGVVQGCDVAAGDAAIVKSGGAMDRLAPGKGRTVELAGGEAPVEITLVTGEDVDETAVAYALSRLQEVVEQVAEPILFARITLTRAPDPARPKRAIAQATLDIDGELVRAHVAAPEMPEAVDLLQARLRHQLDQRAQRRRALRRRPGYTQPGEWRHGDPPIHRPDYFDRPPTERQLVRHKTFAAGELTPDEAAFDLEQLDYEFHVFRDLASGEDALIERLPDRSYRLTRLHPAAIRPEPLSVDLVVADEAPPELTIDQALERLEAADEKFVFFADSTTKRGSVVYHRYDGHYGMITLE
jgi:ribosome-associated translation inhibitor RaiA